MPKQLLGTTNQKVNDMAKRNQTNAPVTVPGSRVVVDGDKKVTILEWHGLLCDAIDGQATARDAVRTMVELQYQALPSYTDAQADRDALKILAKERGKSAEYYVQVYGQALKAKFGDLPRSSDPESIARAERRAKAKAEKRQTLIDAGLVKPNAKKGEHKTEKPLGGRPAGTPSRELTIEQAFEQIVAAIGIDAALDHIAKILLANNGDADKLPAMTLTTIANQYRAVHQPRKAA